MIYTLLILSLLIALEIGSLSYRLKVVDADAIQQALTLTGSADPYLGFETTWQRHPVLATPAAAMPDDGSLPDYSSGSFLLTFPRLKP